MNLLAPWFLAGLVLVAGPIVAHLIRRATRQRVAFSTLRFLEESAPRLDRRSRIQHPWLLLLRCLIVAVLALAFARPYLQRIAPPVTQPRALRHMVVLLDQSASMQRDGLWDAARERVLSSVRSLTPGDQLVLLGFAADVMPLVTSTQWNETAVDARLGTVRARLQAAEPGWGPAHLDSAVEAAMDHWEELAEQGNAAGERQVVIVSDFAGGTRLSGLASRDWPSGAQVELQPVRPAEPANASLQWLGWSRTAEDRLEARFRVYRSFDTPDRLEWQVRDATTRAPLGDPSPVEVLPGDTLTLTYPWPGQTEGPLLVELRGDAHGFDNQLWLAAPRPPEIGVYYLGDDAADDPQGTHFYLARALAGLRVPVVTLAKRLPEKITSPALVIVDRILETSEREAVQAAVAEGAYVLALVESEARLAEAAQLAGEDGWQLQAPERSDALLGQVDFGHPLFAPFADPRFSDFTRIRFWQPQPIALPPETVARVVARFDDGQAALVESTVGHGHVIVWGGSWAPRAGQWVLSSKFVPWLQALLERAVGGVPTPAMQEVGRFAGAADARLLHVAGPDGPRTDIAGAPDAPGIYREPGDNARLFAFNVPTAESDLEPLPLDIWEQLGVPLSANAAVGRTERAADREQARSDLLLEREQRGWRWLLAVALVLLALESLLARRLLNDGGFFRRPAPPSPRTA